MHVKVINLCLHANTRVIKVGLRAYAIRRAILMIPVLIGVTLLVFTITQFFDPVARASLYVDITKVRNMTAVIEKYGLNDPIYVQYFRWLSEVSQGNLGYSREQRMYVLPSLLKKFPVTAEIVLYSVPVTIFLGIYLGVKSAVHRNKAIDHMTRVVAIIGWSLPTFWSAIILLSVFYGGFGVFPPERLSRQADSFIRAGIRLGTYHSYTGLNTIDGLVNGQPWIIWDALQHLVLPVTNLIIVQIALIIRVMRSSMLEALNKGYMVTARAKGLSQSEVINKHARRNALIPVVTLSGLLLAGMLTGMVITETVFHIPGLGRAAANAALHLDIPFVLGFSLLTGIIFVIANLIVDIAYAYVDPRIRLG